MNVNAIHAQRAEVVINWLNRLWTHYKGSQPTSMQQQGRVTGSGFNIMAHEVENFMVGLADFSPAVLDQAFNTHLLSSQWLPKVSQIRDLATAITQASNLSPDEYHAWDSFCNALKNESPVGPMPRFHNEKIPQVINDLGGWKHLAQRNDSELQMFVRKEFLQRYQSIKKQENERQLLLKSAKTTGQLSGVQIASTHQIGR